MIKVDLDDSLLKYHYRRTDRRTTLSLELLLRLKIFYPILDEIGQNSRKNSIKKCGNWTQDPPKNQHFFQRMDPGIRG